jgi:uncharacterized protein YbaR (Trm112 family)
MDLLACPICKNFPLKLYVFSQKELNRELKENKPLCEIYCSFTSSNVKDLKDTPCEKCIRFEIVDGILICEKCNRWYPIIDEIPRMLPDNLRKREEDLAFLNRYKDTIPKSVLENGLPFNLKD